MPPRSDWLSRVHTVNLVLERKLQMDTVTSSAYLYSSLAEDEILRDLVQLFVEEMPQRAESLAACLQALEWDSLRRAAHQLKGSAGSYGFTPLSVAAARVEQAIVEELPEEEIRRSAEELIAMCGRVRAGTP